MKQTMNIYLNTTFVSLQPLTIEQANKLLRHLNTTFVSLQHTITDVGKDICVI